MKANEKGSANKIIIAVLTVLVMGLSGTVYVLRNSAQKASLAPVSTAIANLRGALMVGISYPEYRQRVQALAGALLQAQEEGADVAPYGPALEKYSDVLKLWQDHIEHSNYYDEGERNLKPPVLIGLCDKYHITYGLITNQESYDAVLQSLWIQAEMDLGKADRKKENPVMEQFNRIFDKKRNGSTK